MIYGSVCSGIEAVSVAWHPLGFKPAWFSEIADFPARVLAHRWPQVENRGDFTLIRGDDEAALDVLVGGTPCQSFSVAGLRKGMDDARGQLALEFLRLAQRTRARWILWENVPGVLSADKGRAFGSFLGGLAELGYGFAYRVLDAQFFGVPQRRRRVFVVGYLGDWRPAAAVLFERESLSRNPPPRRTAGTRTAEAPAYRTGVGFAESDPREPLAFDWKKGGDETTRLHATPESPSLTGDSPHAVMVPLISPAVTAKWAKGTGGPAGDECQNLVTAPRPEAVELAPLPFDETQITHPANRSNPRHGDMAPALAKGARPPSIAFQPHEGQPPLGFYSNRGQNCDLCTTTEGTPPVARKSDVAVAYALRADASRVGEAKTPSPDAEGRVRLRDPGFTVEEELSPTLDASAPHTVAQPIEAYQCHGNNVGPAGTLRTGNGGVTGGVPFVVAPPVAYIVNAAESCAKESHARPVDVARCLDTTGGFAASQGGTVVTAPIPLLEVGKRAGREGHEDRDGLGLGEPGDPMYTLQAGAQHGVAVESQTAVAYSITPEGGQGADLRPKAHTPLGIAFQGGSQQDQIISDDGISPALAHASNSHGGHYQPKLISPSPFQPSVSTEEAGSDSKMDTYLGDVVNGLDASYGKGPGARGGAERPVAAAAMAVRRLTPRECERLQGFPDLYTEIPGAKDGPRYRALGNSMAVPCMRWLGERIQLIDGILHALPRAS